MKALSKGQTALFLAFLILMWGVNWPLSKFALNYAPPILFSGIRTLIAGLLLLVVALPRLRDLRWKQTWKIYAISAILNIILFYGCQTIGIAYMPAGLFSAIVFLQPVLVGFLSWLWVGESMNPLKAIGLVLGCAGVATISAGGFSGSISVIGIVLALASAVSWGVGTVYVKKVGDRVDPIWLVTIQLIMGGVVMTAVGTGTESWGDITWNATFIGVLLFICIFAIALSWLCFFRLVGSGEASTVGSYTFLIPLVSIILSVIFMGESVTVNLIIGLVLIVMSILLVNRTPKEKSNHTPVVNIDTKEVHS